jgi:hypothetical protein
MSEAITREEKYLKAIASGGGIDLKPITRKEMFLAKAAGQDIITPTPITREEMFLSKIIQAIGNNVVLEGDGQDFHQFAPTPLTFRSEDDLADFQEVQINGETVDPANYTIEEGSTIVTFPIEYLKTLDKGKYEVAIVSKSKTVKGNFTVTAPELNEHGFYYNQPYTAYVAMLGGKKAFFLREDGTIDVIDVASGALETGTFACDGKNATMNISAGTLTGAWADDGKSIYCNELQVIASLGDEFIISDEDYIYVYNDSLGGYSVTAIDKTKSEYGAIKTGINDKPTVKLGALMFKDNTNLIVTPKIPDSVVCVGTYAFANCTRLTCIDFEGTIEQWNVIALENLWNENVPATYVQCSDGQVAL